MIRMFLKASALLSLGFLVACGGAAPAETTFPGAPSWYDNPIAGCGVGSAKHRGNRNLTKEAATSRARRDLAAQLKANVQGMVKDYAAMGEAEGKEFSEELVTSVGRQIVDQTLVGTRVANSKLVGSEMYVNVCLDPATFADAFDKMNELDGKAREALKKRSQAEFADLDAQLAKIKGE